MITSVMVSGSIYCRSRKRSFLVVLNHMKTSGTKTVVKLHTLC